MSKIILFMVFFLCALPSFAQNTQKRVALVLGNNSYSSPNTLMNQGKDADDVADVLKELGFEVIRAVNQNKQQTEMLIETFGKKLADTKGVGLFYYTGIGFQSNGENFLVPSNANFFNIDETIKTSVSLKTVLDLMNSSKNDLNLILLDAVQNVQNKTIWQNEEFAFDNIGFAKVLPAPDTLVFYSSETGRVALSRCGRNSLFAGSFLNYLRKGSSDFGQLAINVSEDVKQKTNNQQQPFINGFLSKNFYLVDESHKLNADETLSLEYFFTSYKAEVKCLCGHREESISIGKKIIENFEDDKLNAEVIEYVKKKTQLIEKEDSICRRNELYDNAYRSKNWNEFFKISKEIIEKEENPNLVLDVMLTLVSVGYVRSVSDKDDS